MPREILYHYWHPSENQPDPVHKLQNKEKSITAQKSNSNPTSIIHWSPKSNCRKAMSLWMLWLCLNLHTSFALVLIYHFIKTFISATKLTIYLQLVCVWPVIAPQPVLVYHSYVWGSLLWLLLLASYLLSHNTPAQCDWRYHSISLFSLSTNVKKIVANLTLQGSQNITPCDNTTVKSQQNGLDYGSNLGHR